MLANFSTGIHHAFLQLLLNRFGKFFLFLWIKHHRQIQIFSSPHFQDLEKFVIVFLLQEVVFQKFQRRPGTGLHEGIIKTRKSRFGHEDSKWVVNRFDAVGTHGMYIVDHIEKQCACCYKLQNWLFFSAKHRTKNKCPFCG